MAKDAHDREDLLRDATGYAQRIELRIAGVESLVFCGFRPDGGLSIYWGQDEVVQFNSMHELRRAFTQDRMLASYERRLFWLNRDPTTARASLAREAVPEEAAASFLALWARRLETLHAALTGGDYEVQGKVPSDSQTEHALRDWLAHHRTEIRLAGQPGAV